MRVLLAAALSAAMLASCSQPGLVAPDANRDSNAPALQTSQAEYRVTRTARTLETSIGFSYVNNTRQLRYVGRCHQPDPPYLERWTGSEWVVAYSPVVLLCWQPPLEIAPGATYAGTLEVRAWLPGNNTSPDWRVDGVPGMYRLVWRLLRSKNSDGPASQPETLFSNTFTLTES